MADDIAVEATAGTTPHAEPRRAGGVLPNALAMASGEMLARAVAFAMTAYLSRRLGAAQFGVVGFATAVTGYFGLVVTAGAARVGAREVARTPSQVATLAASVAALRLMIAAVAFAALWVAVGYVTTLDTATRALVRISGLTLFAVALDASWALKGLGRGTRVGAALVAGQVLSLAGILLFVRGPGDALRVPVAQFAGDTLGALLLLVPLVARTRGITLGPAVRLLRTSAVPMATTVLRTLIFTFDVVLLGLLGRDADVGRYTAAYRVCNLLLAVGVAVHTSFWPAAARATSGKALGGVVSRAAETAAVVGAPLVAGGIVLAEPLMRTLFGAEFAAGAPMLRWLLVSIACVLIHGAFTTALLAAGRVRRELGIMAVVAALNVVLNLLIIPRYGATGAAAVTAASEGVALILCVLAGRAAGWQVRGAYLARPLFAAGVMAALLSMLAPTAGALAVSVPAGGIIYAVTLLALGLPVEFEPALARARSFVQGAVTWRRARSRPVRP